MATDWPERHQRKRPALALVVGVEQDQHVLERDDEQQRPGHQREDAEHRLRPRRAVLRRSLHGLLQSVEGRGADVAVDDADGAQRQRPEVLVLGAGPGVGTGRRGRLLSHIWQLLDCCRAQDARANGRGLYTRPTAAEVNRGNTVEVAA